MVMSATIDEKFAAIAEVLKSLKGPGTPYNAIDRAVAVLNKETKSK